MRRRFLPILLARLQRSDTCRRIRHRRPDHAVVTNDLRTGGPIRLTVLTGLIAIEKRAYTLRAPCTRSSAAKRKSTAAARPRSAARTHPPRQPLGHHERRLDRSLPSAAGSRRRRPAQPETDGAVVRRRQFVGCRPSTRHRSHRGRPSANARDAIAPARARRHATSTPSRSVRSHAARRWTRRARTPSSRTSSAEFMPSDVS